LFRVSLRGLVPPRLKAGTRGGCFFFMMMRVNSYSSKSEEES
jgi:hypothetical protein